MAILSSSLTIDTLILASIILLLFYYKYLIKFQYWKKLNIPYLEPSFPFGNLGDALTFRRPMHNVYQDIYNKIKYELKLPYCGTFTASTPVLVLTDPEIIKHVLIKDFDVFIDRGFFEPSPDDEPMLKNLFSLVGDEWRKLRNKMSPTFTSGRIKEMFPLIEACGKNLVSSLTENLRKEPNKSIDVKEWLSRYMTDVIGSSVFGMEIDAVVNPECEFMKTVRKISHPAFRVKLVLAIYLLWPKLRELIKFDFMDRKVTNFYSNLVLQNMNFREENNVKRKDFINIMMQLKKEDPEITEDVILAQCFVFFIAGFDTSSSILTHCLYELGNNKDLQSRLRQEIWDTKRKYGGELTYESFQEKEMPLLDRAIKECLRMYPPLPQLDRITSRPYTIPNTDITLPARTKILIPMFGLHYDPEFFVNPETFDPDRFAPGNVDRIPNYVYLPFGEGPHCVGKRYGILQLKSGLALLVSNFEWNPDPTNVLEYSRGEISMRLTKDLKLKPKAISQ